MFRRLFGAHARILRVALAALVTMQGVAFVLAVPAAASAGTVLLSDDFTNGSVSSSRYVIGGSGFTPCLTATGAGASIPGRCSPTIDPAGAGALRLTTATKNQAGYLLYNNALPTKAGLDISFNMFQYGGTGADGIAFFLTNGAYSLTTPGPDGGSLGYQYNGSVLGLDHSLLGVGLDAFGNYSVEWNDPACPIQRPQATPFGQEIAVRGPGGADRKSGYCLLGHPVHVPHIDNIATQTRNPSEHAVHIVIDPPSDPTPQVRVSLDGTLETTVPEPAVLASTPTFKFGWAASTGGSTDVHEINLLKVSTVDPITPQLSVTATPTASMASGGTASIVATPTSSPAAGPESDPVTLDLTAPSGASFVGTPSGNGWACSPAAGQIASCTFTPTAALLPGTVLPAVTAEVTSSGSGIIVVTSAVSSADNTATGAQVSASTTVTVRPTAATVSGLTVAATNPAPITVVPPPAVGSGPFTYSLASIPGAADGTASIDPTNGAITFTPAPGTSGISTFTYQVTDPHGVSSPPTPVTITTRPVASPQDATTDFATAITLPAPHAPIGTGPFRYELVTTPAADEGAASIDPDSGRISLSPAKGYSGAASFTYRLSDADGVLSDAAPVTVIVRPGAPEVTATMQLDAEGDAGGMTTPPSPGGTGPFTYALVDQPSSGIAVIDSTTGVISYVTTTGVSGTFTTQYTVTDANGVVSPPATATITVLPYGPAERGSTDSASPVTLDPPATVGSGPFTYALVGLPAGTNATIDPATGAITFDPSGQSGQSGQSGPVDFSYEATDSHGGSTGPVAVHIDVQPAAIAPAVPALTPPWKDSITVDAPTSAPATSTASTDSPVSAPATPPSIPSTLAFTGFDPGLELLFVALLTAAGVGLRSFERRRRRRA